MNDGNWNALKSFLEHRPDALTAKISDSGNTVLIDAVVAGHTNIVKELVNLMSVQDLEAQDISGYTALAAAARGGIKEIAETLVAKNRKLVSVSEFKNKKIPIVIASENGHEDMTRYLYDITPLEDLKDKNGVELLKHCISAGTLFDIALDLLQRCPKLGIPFDEKVSPLLVLSQMPSAFPSSSRLPFFQTLLYFCIPVQSSNVSRNLYGDIESPNVVSSFTEKTATKVPTIDEVYKIKQKHQQSKAVLSLICEEISNLDMNFFEKVGVYKSIFKAIKYGIEEVVEEVLKCHPYIFRYEDRKKRSILSYAVSERQENIFRILIENKRNHILASIKDRNKNNLLHQAAILPSSEQLDKKVTGAALQMQRELQWFEEVKKIVQPRHKLKTNKDGKSPKSLFTDQHKGLVEKGEKWAKDTAKSCSVVAALITTITFEAALEVPGGIKSQGEAFIRRTLFNIYVISDTFSLFSSTIAVLVFLGILTSRYREQDFLKSLPRKLMIGLGTLFFSIATMMIVFATILVIMLFDRWGTISFPLVLLAGGPVILYAVFQFPLLLEIFVSTYGISTFRRPKGNNFFAIWRL
ncbi:hypothetical protein LguiB_032555 [Lonicera macranthoides]